MPLAYRTLSQDDLSAICAFPQTAEELFFIGPKYTYPLTPDQLWATAQERHQPTVIFEETDGKIMAYANLLEWSQEEHCCWMGNVIVAPDARGRGVGEFLLNAMMSQAGQVMEVQRLKLYCHNTNTRAMLFYLKHGFVPNGGFKLMDHPAGHKIVCIEMEKTIV